MVLHQKGHTSLAHIYIVVLAISLAIGLGFPQWGSYMSPLVTFFLGCIFFFSSLRLHLSDVAESVHDIKIISFAAVLKLVILPIIVYYITLALAPHLALSFLILAAMPSAMTAPLFTTMAHGKQSFSLVLSIMTSLVAPLSIPLIIKFLAKSTVSVDIVSMCIRLALIIVLPIILTEGIKYFQPKVANKLLLISRPGSLIALGLLLIGVISVHAKTIINTITHKPSEYLIPLIIFFTATHMIGYIGFLWLPYKKRVAATVSLAYMNFTLAIYLANTFFPGPEIIIPIIISAIPWSIAIIPFAEIAAHHEHT